MALTEKKMIGCRDPLGVRPLLLGDLDGAPVLASETCALDIIGAKLVREVEPGELLVITERRHRIAQAVRAAPAALLHLRARLFRAARFDRGGHQRLRGAQAHRRGACARGAGRRRHRRAGARFRRSRARSASPEAAGIPFDFGIIRNHYVGRTFIEPADAIRHMGVKLKHNANSAVLKGKRVVLVDDSIVRGTTSLKIVQMVRDAGAAEVHMRIASPPTTDPCFYGVDTPEKSKLLASRMSVEEMRDFIGVDSLAFVSIDGLYRAVGEERPQSGRAAILRRLLHRRLSDPPDRPGERSARCAS